MHRMDYRIQKKTLAIWGMMLFLGIYVIAIPFHFLLGNHACHDSAHSHSTDCPLCTLADLPVEMPSVDFELPFRSCALFLIILLSEDPLIALPSLVPHARAPPVA